MVATDGIAYECWVPRRMWKPREPRSIIEAAEKAAEAGNYAMAEDRLREAASLQEASLGPLHPDLANTLNNLGIVCEITKKPIDAEQFFRRAVSIATTSLPPDHPFVTTSHKNLRDFCEARGISVEPPTPQPEVRKPGQSPAAVIDARQEELASKRLFRRVAVGALGPIAALMVILAAGLPQPPASDQPAPSPAIGADSQAGVTSAPSPASIEATPRLEPPPAATTTGSDDAGETRTRDVTPASAPTRPIVVRASLCGSLDDWLCDPSDLPVPPGPLFFYTQITSPTATTVVHRWYQDDRLQHSVSLRVLASQTGYRTFSRNLMTADSAGSWRIELRTEDGALLHVERFTVR